MQDMQARHDVTGQQCPATRRQTWDVHWPWTVTSPAAGRRNPGRSAARGSAALVAITVALVAATVAGALATAATSRLNVVSARTQRADAIATAAAELADLEQALAADPDLYATQVWRSERARVCVDDGATYQPAQVWPASCGLRWTYEQAAAPTAVRVQIVPPSAADPTLHVTVLARACEGDTTPLADCAGEVDSGLSRRYVRQGPAWATVHSDTPLARADLGTEPVQGATIYSVGSIDLTGPGPTFTDTLWATEATIVGTPAADSRTAGPATSPTTVRDLTDAPQTTGGLQAAMQASWDVACPAAPDAIPAVEDGAAAWLCLAPGRLVVDLDGSVTRIPDDVVAYRLWTGADPNQLLVQTATTLPAVPACAAAPCQPIDDLGAGTHPVGGTTWTDLTLNAAGPWSGVVAVAGEAHIGGPVDLTDPANPHNPVPVHTSTPLTILAGTPTDPADIVISAPVDADNSPSGHPTSVVLAATGEVRIGPWAADPTGTLTIDAALVALGLDGPADRAGWPSPIRTDPATAPGYNAAANYGTRHLEIVGAVVAPAISMDLYPFTSVTLTPNPAAAGRPAPHAPTFTSTWQPTGTTMQSGTDLCGNPTCPLF